MRRNSVVGRGSINRRDFLRMGGVSLAGVAAFGMTACGGGGGQQGGGPVTLTFSHTPDPTGSFKQQIDKFNQQNKGEIRVRVREAPPDSGAYFDQLRTQFQAGANEIDVMEGDVTWPAQFGANGWISDLSDRFTDEMQSDYLDGALQSNVYDDAIFGVPWRTDAGLLYYRKDLLDDAGISDPPKTWDDLKQIAEQVVQDSNAENGFVFQGANYEGGLVNGLEYIWTHGGDVLDPDDPTRIVIDSPESVAGIETERSMVADGASPQAVSTYKEDESTAAFLNGKTVFLRNWPYVYAQLSDPEASQISPEQVGIAPLPVASGNGQSFSGLGGWNLLVNESSENQDAAWEFVRFMVAPEQQKVRATKGTYLPTLQSLYDDQELLDKVSVIALGKEAIQNVRSRPVSPYYSDMSLAMAEQFNSSLKGTAKPQQAIKTTQQKLQEIVDQGS